MTAKPGEDDDLEFTDETFVIGDEDDARDLDDVLAQVEQEVESQTVRAVRADVASTDTPGAGGEALTAADLYEREHDAANADSETSATYDAVDDADADAGHEDFDAEAEHAGEEDEEPHEFPSGEHVAFVEEVQLEDDDDAAGEEEEEREESPEDVLFTLASDIHTAVPSEVFGADSPRFGESTGGWGGDAMSPEEIGIDVSTGPVGPYGGTRGQESPASQTGDSWGEAPVGESQWGGSGESGAFAAESGISPTPVEEEFFAEETSGTYGSGSYGDGSESAHDDAAAEQDEDWAPLEEGEGDDEDPIYGAAAAATEAEPRDAEPDFEEHEEQYVDAVPRRRLLLGGGRGGSRRFAMATAAMAAVVLVGAAGAIALVRPQWLGLGSAPALVDRVQIARPDVDVKIEAPKELRLDAPPAGTASTPGTPGTAGSDGSATTGRDPATERSGGATNSGGESAGGQRGGAQNGGGAITRDPATGVGGRRESGTGTAPVGAGDPAATARDPAATSGRAEQPGMASEQGSGQRGDLVARAGDDLFAVPPAPPAVAGTAPGEETMRLGDDLMISATPVTKTPRDRAKLDPRTIGLVPGSQAFAQLHNLNFFIGSVKAMDSDTITMRLEKGEITFGYAALKTLVPLTSSEFQEMQRTSGRGSVTLHNRNRLFGTIIEHPKEENVVLEMKSNRVMIPRALIESIGNDLPTGIRFTDDENDEWVRKLIQNQMEAMPPRPADPAARGKIKVGAEALETTPGASTAEPPGAEPGK